MTDDFQPRAMQGPGQPPEALNCLESKDSSISANESFRRISFEGGRPSSQALVDIYLGLSPQRALATPDHQPPDP